MRDSLPNEIALEDDVLSLEDDGYELEEAVLAELAAAHVQLLHVLRSSVDGSQLPAALKEQMVVLKYATQRPIKGDTVCQSCRRGRSPPGAEDWPDRYLPT
jgi:hypothetical protein